MERFNLGSPEKIKVIFFNKSCLHLALIALLSLSFAVPSFATIYAYTDAQGRIRITDVPSENSRVVVLPRLSPASARTSNTNVRTNYSSALKRYPSVFKEYVKEAAAAYRLSESLIYALMRAESNFNPYAVSSAGARGLMQLIPSTARLVGVNDVFEPRQNILGGAKYLRMMLDRFGRLDLAIAAYNAGPQAVERYGGIPPYSETLNYVPRVLRFFREFGGSGELNLQLAYSGTNTASRRNSSTRSRTRTAADVPIIAKVNTPIFYFRGPDGQIYISNIR